MTLLIGGSGQLGSAIRLLLPGVDSPSRHELDLANTSEIRAQVRAHDPERIINCAAYTDVDGAEGNPGEAELINAAAVGELAAIAEELAIPLATFSTDHVFDGTSAEPYRESSVPNPINAYGRSKLHGETLALRYHGTLVIRTSWLISATHRNFVATILNKAKVGPVRVVDDQWGAPTLVPDLAHAALNVIRHGATGIVHLAGSPATTKRGLAEAAVKASGLDPALIEAVPTAQMQRPARRPMRAVLESERKGLQGIAGLRPWTVGLGPIVREILHRR